MNTVIMKEADHLTQNKTWKPQNTIPPKT